MRTSGRGVAGSARGTPLASTPEPSGKPAESRSSRAGGRLDDKNYTDHHQQELFVLVAARLVAGAFLGARLRGKARSGRRSCDASRTASALLLDTSAVPRS